MENSVWVLGNLRKGIQFVVLNLISMPWLLSQEHTKVGSADSQDIQLCGMGIQAEHCVIDITADAAVILTPYRNAR